MISRNAVACPICKKIIHVMSPGYVGDYFFCPMCGGDWSEKELREKEEQEDK